MKGGIIILENLNKPVSEITKTVVEDKSTQYSQYSYANRVERPQKTTKVDDYRNISSIKKNPFKKKSVKYKAKGRTGLAKSPIWLNWRALEDEGRINIGQHFYKFYSFTFTDKSVPCGH